MCQVRLIIVLDNPYHTVPGVPGERVKLHTGKTGEARVETQKKKPVGPLKASRDKLRVKNSFFCLCVVFG